MCLTSPAFGNRNRYLLIPSLCGEIYTHCFLAILSCIELSLRLLNLLEIFRSHLAFTTDIWRNKICKKMPYLTFLIIKMEDVFTEYDQ